MFRPFLFKNGAKPKNKFFLVLETLEDGCVLLASLPTSKDHVPSDIVVRRGCLDMAERFVNVFVFLSGEEIASRVDGTRFSFSINTFIYGADLDVYPTSQFQLQIQSARTSVEVIGRLDDAVLDELISCLSGSKVVKNKFRKILQRENGRK